MFISWGKREIIMKILIVGLGLMGGAYALKLKKKGHTVYGVDNDLFFN